MNYSLGVARLGLRELLPQVFEATLAMHLLSPAIHPLPKTGLCGGVKLMVRVSEYYCALLRGVPGWVRNDL